LLDVALDPATQGDMDRSIAKVALVGNCEWTRGFSKIDRYEVIGSWSCSSNQGRGVIFGIPLLLRAGAG
jgi:hypothetical protein